MPGRNGSAKPDRQDIDPNIPQTKQEQRLPAYSGPVPERLSCIAARAVGAGLTVAYRIDRRFGWENVHLYCSGFVMQISALLELSPKFVYWPRSYRCPASLSRYRINADLSTGQLFKLDGGRYSVFIRDELNDPPLVGLQQESQPGDDVHRLEINLVSAGYQQFLASTDEYSRLCHSYGKDNGKSKVQRMLKAYADRLKAIGLLVDHAAIQVLAKSVKDPEELEESSKLWRAIDDLEHAGKNISTIVKDLRSMAGA